MIKWKGCDFLNKELEDLLLHLTNNVIVTEYAIKSKLELDLDGLGWKEKQSSIHEAYDALLELKEKGYIYDLSNAGETVHVTLEKEALEYFSK